MTFRFHAQASDEYRQVALYYAERSRHSGVEFVTRLEESIASIQRFPFARRVINTTGVRQILLQQFPYKLVYAVEKDPSGQGSIVVYAVAHIRRRDGYWSDRLPTNDSGSV